uniref:dispanin subfamily A member 2b-like n=1 Tax=Pristiophorus japonicus TaxID=55135 RepID=UPI00398E8F05
MEYRADQMPMNPRTGSPPSNVQPFRDHFVWSIFNFFYMNTCCLGFVALIFSVKSRDRKVVGDVEGARHYASTARSLNIAATVISILVFIIIIGLAFAGVFAAKNLQQSIVPGRGN